MKPSAPPPAPPLAPSSKPAAPRRRAETLKPIAGGVPTFSKISADQHVISILRGAERRQYAPLDAHVRRYFVDNKDAFKAPKLRREVSARVYHLITWRGLLDHIVDPSGLKYVSWEDRLETYKKINVKEKMMDTNLPLHVRCSFPKPLVDRFLLQYTPEQVVEIAKGSNFGAPLTIRVNPAKTTRDALLRALKEKYNFQLQPTERSPLGITFVVKPLEPLQLKQEFKDGLFDIQDEASQVASLMVDPKPDQHVLDFCAGTGGKTLAFAHKVSGKGELHLHDIPQLLNDAQRRLKRAGITNAHFYALEDKFAGVDEEGEEEAEADDEGNDSASDKAMKKVVVPRAAEGVFKELDTLTGKVDWVLADVPCSGTGVYRRNPDMRWRFNEETMGRLTELQRRLATTASRFLARGGHLVYSTCSVLQEENEEQVVAICKSEKMELVGEPFRSLPKQGGMDGFFAAVMRRK